MALAWRNKFFGKSTSRFKVQLKQNKPYIIPTGFGLCFAVILLVLLYSSFASGNNLLYLYTFFFTSVAISTLSLTHLNISKVRIESVDIQEIYADSPASGVVQIFNAGDKTRYFFGVYQSKEKLSNISEIAAGAFAQTRIEFGFYPRGSHQAPRVVLNTTFPFYLLNTWKVYRSPQEFLVFPKREGVSDLPYQGTLNESDEGRAIDQVRSSEFEFAGHRRFEPSDSFRQVDWKAYARTDRMLVKDYEGFRPQEIKIHWHNTSQNQDIEKRLSQMALWIEIAESKGFHYSVHLPGENSKTSRGRAHYLVCLKSLALFTLETPLKSEGALET